MATAKQLAALRKARQAKADKALRRSLGGILPANIMKGENLLNNLKNAGLVVAGFLIGKEGSAKLFKADPTNPKDWKNYAGMALQLGGGLVLASQKHSALQYLGVGMIGGGLLEGTTKLTGRDLYNEGLLSGLVSAGKQISGLKGLASLHLPELEALALKDQQDLDDEVIEFDDYEIEE